MWDPRDDNERAGWAACGLTGIRQTDDNFVLVSLATTTMTYATHAIKKRKGRLGRSRLDRHPADRRQLRTSLSCYEHDDLCDARDNKTKGLVGPLAA